MQKQFFLGIRGGSSMQEEKDCAKKTQAARPSPSLRKISRYLLCLLLVVSCVLIVLLYFSFRYSSNDSRVKIMSSIETQMVQIEQDMYNISHYLFSLVINNSDTHTIRSSDTVNIRNTAARALWNNMDYQNRIFGSAYSFMLYVPEKNITVHSRSTTTSYDNDETIKAIIKNSIEAQTYASNDLTWNVLVADGTAYMTQTYQSGGTYACSWISCDKLFSFLTVSSVYQQPSLVLLNKGNLPLLPRDTEALDGVQIKDDTVVKGKLRRDYFYYSMERGDINLLFSSKTAFDYPRLLLFSGMYLLILLIILAFYAYTLVYYKRYIQAPLQTLHMRISDYATMRHKAKKKGFAELEAATEAFDSLTQQINALKIDFYEEKLLLAKTELDYYQLQIKPHFFINCLNIIYSMGQKKEYIRIQEFCLCLSNYVRYLFSNTFDTVPIQDELMHLENYLRIQSIRRRAAATLHKTVEPDICDCKIPPLLLLTFVENSIKYSGLPPEELVITLDIQKTTCGPDEWLEIHIQDNGQGFPPGKIEEISQERSTLSGSGRSNVGILNVYRRLQLLYGEQFAFEISNRNQGSACIYITIPAQLNLGKEVLS